MSNFWWIILLVAVFVGGQWAMMRPNPREQRVMHLRDAARKMGLQPKLVPPPEWFKTESRQFIACYSLIVPTAKLPYSRAERQADGTWKTITGNDLLVKAAIPSQADLLLAIEAQANSISFYWQEEAEQAVLEPLKAWLQSLAA